MSENNYIPPKDEPCPDCGLEPCECITEDDYEYGEDDNTCPFCGYDPCECDI